MVLIFWYLDINIRPPFASGNKLTCLVIKTWKINNFIPHAASHLNTQSEIIALQGVGASILPKGQEQKPQDTTEYLFIYLYLFNTEFVSPYLKEV